MSLLIFLSLFVLLLVPLFFLYLACPLFLGLAHLLFFWLVGLNTISHDLSLALLVNSNTIKLLTKVITNIFGKTFLVIAHPFHNGYIIEQNPGISFEVEIANWSLSVNVIFDA